MSIYTKYTDYSNDAKISDDELVVINKFLDFYRNQTFIVADEYRQDFSMVPLENQKVIFKINNDTWKSVDFCRRIYYKGRPYVVELSLWRTSPHVKTDPKCLEIKEFNIITRNTKHSISLNIDNPQMSKILFNIISIFDEKKIISPEQAYSNRMYTNNSLKEFIKNHEWDSISKGIKQMPKLANALFIIDEDYEGVCRYSAHFGTILYHLISFKKDNLDNLSVKDMQNLNKLILNLRNTELLKVRLFETFGIDKIFPTDSILLDANIYANRLHLSSLYNTCNTRLYDEKKILNQSIREAKNNAS